MSKFGHITWALAAAMLACVSAALASSRAERRRELVESDLRQRLRRAETRARELERSAQAVVPREPAVDAPPATSAAAPSSDEPARAVKPAAAPAKPVESLADLSRPERLIRLREIFAGGDRKAQLAALDHLPSLSGPEALELALPLLTGGPPWLRRKAVDILGRLNDAAALPALQKVYEQDPGLRVPAAQAMARLGQAEPLRQLTSQAALDLRGPDAGLRESAAGTLGRIATPDVVPLLSGALLDADFRVRKEAVEALASTRLPEAVALLESALAGADPATQDWIRKELAELRAKK